MQVALVTAKVEYQLKTEFGAKAMSFDTEEAARRWLNKRNAKLTEKHTVAPLNVVKVTTLYEIL